MARKIFGTDGVRGTANCYPMTADVALKLGQAAAIVFRKDDTKKHKVIIGKDTRASGYIFEYALTSGLCSMGVDVYLVGPMPTPAIAHLTKSFAADAGIVISASHNPSEDNGIKFFGPDGFKLPDETEEKIEELVFRNNFQTECYNGSKVGKAFKIEDARGRYIEFAKNTIQNMSLKGIKIVLDCANGAAYYVAPLIFRELGAEVVVLNNKPDGENINDECGAMHPEVIQAAVLGHKADIGIALDGDADRVIMVDEKGEEVDGDRIIGMCALDMKKMGVLNKNTLVATVMSNIGLESAMKKNGIKLVRTPVGDRYLIEEMRKHGYSLGGEQSGHIIFMNHLTSGDGTISALRVLKLMKDSGKKLSQLKSFMTVAPQILKNIKVKEKIPLEELPAVQKEIKAAENKLKDTGRVLVRYSGTENKCRVMVEGTDERLTKDLSEKIVATIKREIGE